MVRRYSNPERRCNPCHCALTAWARRRSVSPPAFAALVHLLEQQEDHGAAEDARDDPARPAGARAERHDVERREDDADDEPWDYSHSIVPGGLLVMSSTTRLTSRISLIIREAICSSRSYGSLAQSAVIASSEVTARMATT